MNANEIKAGAEAVTPGPTKKGGSNMKYFNFSGKFPYYALIAANSEYEAIGVYVSEISTFNDDCIGEMPDEISIESAREAFMKSTPDDANCPDNFDDYEKELNGLPHVVLIDADLC